MDGAEHDFGLSSNHFAISQRKAKRKAMRLAGEVSFGDKANRMRCWIVDMSATGARLRIDTADKRFGPRIGLYFGRPATSVECQVIWVRDGEVGVRFCSRFHHQHQPG